MEEDGGDEKLVQLEFVCEADGVAYRAYIVFRSANIFLCSVCLVTVNNSLRIRNRSSLKR